MSYLSPLRLHFSGRFQADPSTVNNDVRHFDNATFQPEFQQPQTGTPWNGWWEPNGSGAYRLVGCTVTAVSYGDGTSSPTDSVVGLAVADANARVAGKIVDLDPQQQLVSQVWGLIVRLTDGTHDLFSGPFDVASFSDLWGRAQGPGNQGDVGMGTYYQSVIGPVSWGDTGGSRFLRELRAACPEGLLSIKFNVDGYNLDSTSAAFTMGRIVGTIGPASSSEPRHFVLGRQLLPQVTTQDNPNGPGNPSGPMNFMPAVVDLTTRRVLADFGNALPTQTPGGPLTSVGTGNLELGYLDAGNGFHPLGTVNYLQPNWYATTAGIQAIPPDRPLTDTELTALGQNRVAVALAGAPIVQENYQGLYLRADTFTFRVEPYGVAAVQLWAAQYGQPLANAQVTAFADPSGLQAGGGDPNIPQQPPALATPENTLSFPATLYTDAHGRVTLPIAASDPGNPRGYIDGQVYGVRYLLSAIAQQFGQGATPPVVSTWTFGYDPWDFVSLLVFDTYPVPAQPTWYDLQPIWQQYANLYPIMGGLVNLASYDDVVAHAKLLAFAFGLPQGDPNHMPVTRDLSQGKRAAILEWLTKPGPDGKPRLGQPPTVARAAPVAARETLAAPAPAGDARSGAKTHAMSQRRARRTSAKPDGKK